MGSREPQDLGSGCVLAAQEINVVTVQRDIGDRIGHVRNLDPRSLPVLDLALRRKIDGQLGSGSVTDDSQSLRGAGRSRQQRRIDGGQADSRVQAHGQDGPVTVGLRANQVEPQPAVEVLGGFRRARDHLREAVVEKRLTVVPPRGRAVFDAIDSFGQRVPGSGLDDPHDAFLRSALRDTDRDVLAVRRNGEIVDRLVLALCSARVGIQQQRFRVRHHAADV